MTPTLEQFSALWHALGLSDSDGVVESAFNALASAYSSSRRRYHTLVHIGWGLKRIDEMAADDATRGSKFVAEDWNVIRFAFWFHDYVMDGSPSDEEASADAACRYLPPPLGDRVRRLIMATSHDRIPLEYDAAIICDADLSILGASSEAFDTYESNVRAEWEHVPEELFRPARYAIMKRFVDRPWIYMTLYARERWERPARWNLDRSLGKLTDSGAGSLRSIARR